MPTKNDTQETAPEVPKDVVQAEAELEAMKAESAAYDEALTAAIEAGDRVKVRKMAEARKNHAYDLIGAEMKLRKAQVAQYKEIAEAALSAVESSEKKKTATREKKVQAEADFAAAEKAWNRNRSNLRIAENMQGNYERMVKELKTKLSNLLAEEAA